MSELNIKDYILKELNKDEQKTALSFINFLESKSLVFYKDDNGYWKDKIYYWVKFKNKCICFISIEDPDEKDANWTVWSDNIQSDLSENYPIDKSLKEKSWKYIDICCNCSSCGGGKSKTIFGRHFDKVCSCTFRIDNPKNDDLEFLKFIVNIKLSEIK